MDGRTRLAVALKAARLASGFTGAEAGAAASMGQSKVSKIERAALLPSVPDVRALSRVYGLPGERRDELVSLAEALRAEQAARLTMSRRVGEMQHRIGQLKRSSTLIRAFQPTTIFGLLQTPSYAACVFGQPDSRQLDSEAANEAVDERLAQQGVLEDPSKQVRLIMSEGALRWHAGSATIMAEQMDSIATAISRRSSIRIGIIPWTRPVQVFPQHGFHIYDENAVVFGTETATAFLTGAADVATYVELFTTLEAEAIYDDDARVHVVDLAEHYRSLPV